MTDLHTHILPWMDDGARDVGMSLRLLREEAAQGVTTVALTPHFYRYRETPRAFLERREKAASALQGCVKSLPQGDMDTLPRLILGAEVAWAPHMAEWPELRELCYEGTDYLLLEPPMSPWTGQVFSHIYALMEQTGITPVIAHIERYFRGQKAEALTEMLSLGCPVQLSAEALTSFAGRRKALRCLKEGKAKLLISDCHNTGDRAPNLKAGYEVIEKKLGADFARQLKDNADALLK